MDRCMLGCLIYIQVAPAQSGLADSTRFSERWRDVPGMYYMEDGTIGSVRRNWDSEMGFVSVPGLF